ncbi:MAG: sensor domain-containing phosphodiesterase [Patulibacter sp.]|nr:sensor domain-containing phosphodiesterase [Patulibacter sp.]
MASDPVVADFKAIMRSPDPLRDPARLAAIAELSFEDGPQRASLDRLTTLAAHALEVPSSSLSIVTADRQVQVAASGPPEERAGELPLSHSFCRRVVSGGEPVLIADVSASPLAGSPVAYEFGIAAYAGVPLRLSHGEVVGAFCVTDTEPREWRDRQLLLLLDLSQMAVEILEHGVATEMLLRDDVTHLPRKTLFTDEVSAMQIAAAAAGRRVVMVAVNLADFRLINDAYGHAEGDRLLAETADRLAHLARTETLPGDVCRLAGDTFLLAAIVNENMAGREAAAHVLRVIHGRPFLVAGQEQKIVARVASVWASDGLSAAEAIQAASIAISRERLRSRSDVASNAAGPPALRRLMIRNELPGVESRGELAVVYQPIVDLHSGDVTCVEALVRWSNPKLGFVGPDEFIPLAEADGAIIPIGDWVLEQAVAQLAAWRTDAHPTLTLAINVAPEQLLISAWTDRVARTLERHGVPAEALTVEITERTLISDEQATEQTLTRLRDMGVRLSMDDFGTGFSSFGRLTDLALDEIKLDRGFIAGLDDHPRRRQLIAGLLSLARHLELDVVAEGIETANHANTLRDMSCRHGQGYHFARPGTPQDITDLLRHN